MSALRFTELDTPVPDTLIDECVDLWDRVFGGEHDSMRAILRGEESAENRDFLYAACQGERLVGTCHLTVPREKPELGGLGEVAVDPLARRSGLATTLCKKARERFFDAGGQAVFLGTINPEARRVYERLGWRKLAGSTVMALVRDAATPEEFLVDHFREESEQPVVVGAGAAADRIPMIPLFVTPHDWQVLDANVDHYSTRYTSHEWCMSLYPRYQAVRPDGEWFAARTPSGRVVGISTVKLMGDGRARVDGVAQARYLDCWEELIERVMTWAAEHGATILEARVSREDEDKQRCLEAVGFREAREVEGFECLGVEGVLLHKSVTGEG